jgi:hypothetical protein
MLGANRPRRACYRHLRHGCHGGRGGVWPDEEAPMFTTTAVSAKCHAQSAAGDEHR